MTASRKSATGPILFSDMRQDVDAGQCERFPCSMVMVLGDLLRGTSQNKVSPSSQSWFSEKHGISNSFRLRRITIWMM